MFGNWNIALQHNVKIVINLTQSHIWNKQRDSTALIFKFMQVLLHWINSHSHRHWYKRHCINLRFILHYFFLTKFFILFIKLKINAQEQPPPNHHTCPRQSSSAPPAVEFMHLFNGSSLFQYPW